jgi:hypothetical protein
MWAVGTSAKRMICKLKGLHTAADSSGRADYFARNVNDAPSAYSFPSGQLS